MEEPSTQPPIHPATRIGHVHLKVADIERALGFYRDLLGFEVTQWYGEDAVFLSAGGYHHHIGLNTWAGRGVPPAPQRSAGLFHLAILYPERRELAKALRSLIDAGYPNGVELYCDRPREEWPHDRDGGLAMVTRPLDLEGLLAELEAPG